MQLNAEQLVRYAADGYLVLADRFSDSEIQFLKKESSALRKPGDPSITWESDKTTVRGLHGCHLIRPVFKNLTVLSRILEPARQLLGGEVYVYQFKIHPKAAFSWEAWKWHQDYIYWRNEDGMPAPSAINVVIFLDEVTEFNGPVMFVRGSHRRGLIEVPAATSPDQGGAAWLQHVSVDLKYTVPRQIVADLTAEDSIVAPKGRAGTIVLFDPNVVHASAPNLSPFDRTSIIITYNSCTNVPKNRENPRPEFLVSRDTRPIQPILVDSIFVVDAIS